MMAGKEPIRIELPTGLAVGSVNAYLFVEPEPALVDTGLKTDESWSALEKGLEESGLAVADLRRVVITHPHVDHFGQARRITEHSEAQIWIAELGVPWLLQLEEMWVRRLDYYRRQVFRSAALSESAAELILSAMAETAAKADSVSAERIVTFQPGDLLQLGGLDWEVVHTPGHAQSQTCFFQAENGWFLSADMLLAIAPMPIVERPPAGVEREPALPRFLESLDVVAGLDIRTVYPGHGEPFGQHAEVIRRQRARIEQRKLECWHLVNGGHHTIADLVEVMYEAYPAEFRFAGVWMLIGYLDLLQAEGRVRLVDDEGVWRFYATQQEAV